MRQAQSCNMRSKCRCSCVLQFTLCHAVSCVLHRPPSQLIHCIALYLGYQTVRLLIEKKRKKPRFHRQPPGEGRQARNLRAGKLSLNRLRYQTQAGSQNTPDSRRETRAGVPAWATRGRQALGPRSERRDSARPAQFRREGLSLK